MSQSAENRKYKEMSAGQKIVFVGKLILFICSFGFAYPTLLNDPDYAGGTVNRKPQQQTKVG